MYIPVGSEGVVGYRDLDFRKRSSLETQIWESGFGCLDDIKSTMPV